MKKILKKLCGVALAALLGVLCLLPIAACKNPPPPVEPLTMLKAVGDVIKDEDGEGDVVYLRGANAGGLFVIEQWMTGFVRFNNMEEGYPCLDHKTTTKKFIERFGEETTKAMWQTYQENWWSEQDFKNCADMGMTAIRLPFTYMNVDFDAILSYENAGQNYDFTVLDNFVEKAAEYGMYTILDLHGVYGSQSGHDHTGEVISNPDDVDFYSNEQMQNLTVKLWRALAEHYADNPNVAAYDLINEPGERRDWGPENGGVKSTEKRHWDFMDKAYDAVREVDQNHIVIFESCWEGDNLPHPSQYGWENCMYSFHHYSGQSSYESHAPTINAKISGVTRKNFGVPMHLGEFTCYDNEESWNYTLETLNRNGWHWNSWSYKVNVSNRSPWGIVRTTGEEVDPVSDEESVILQKWEGIRTTEQTEKTKLRSGTTIYDIMKKYCKQITQEAEKVKLADGEYSFTVADNTAMGLAVGSTVGNYTVLTAISGTQDSITVANHSDNDGSVYLKTAQGNLGVYAYNEANYVGVTKSTYTAARFFPLKVDENTYVLLSYSTCRYLRFDETENAVKADGVSIEDALKVNL